MNDYEQLKLRVTQLEQEVAQLKSLLDVFSGMIIFKKKVQFKANVYDAAGGIVTEINNL